ncbi:response regulator [Mucilaginibacter sp. KACC 22063]|uniref:response regulator n=1 Tax=Mucilaginibacter sp. KACC 22063 TaxID=3025666 RepID=UPI002366EDB5|nr:response regulator [Mucilaginibacter sp. KACC 22063]WDF54644.1 response regulator [Mucilaginibacter sp. KACC 22063]
MKILVIEDNHDIMHIVNFILQDKGYDVVSCKDGSAINHLDTIKPDLILIDELLPTMKGSQACSILKADPTFKQIPVILTSAATNLKEIANDCSADAYIEKPFDIQAVTDLVENLLNRKIND